MRGGIIIIVHENINYLGFGGLQYLSLYRKILFGRALG